MNGTARRVQSSYNISWSYRGVGFGDALRASQINQVKLRVDHGALVEVLARDRDADARMRSRRALVHGVAPHRAEA